MVSSRNFGGGNFRLAPPGGGMSENVPKIALFETTDDFVDFSWINGEKLKNSKTIVSTTGTSPNIPRKFQSKISSSF